MKLVYIAGRYRGRTPETVQANIEAARFIGLLAAEKGWFPVIPHLNTQGFEDILSHDDDFYLEGTLELMRRCDAVVMVPGWQKSAGAVSELDDAVSLSMEYFLSVEDMPEVDNYGI